jgi:hypothetical protein
MRMRPLLSLLSGCLLVTASAEAQFKPEIVPGENYHVEASLMFWQPTPEITLSTDALQGHDVDFVKELTIENERFNDFRSAFKVGQTHRLRVNFMKIQYEKDTFIQRTFVYNNRTYSIGLPVNADLTWDLWRFGHEWDFFVRNRGFIGLMTDVKFNKIDVGLATPVAGAVARQVKFPLPTTGVIARGYPGKYVSATAEFTYFKLPDFSDKYEAKYHDFDIYALVSIGEHLGVQGGFRTFKLDYFIDEDSGRLKMTGPYFGGVARF